MILYMPSTSTFHLFFQPLSLGLSYFTDGGLRKAELSACSQKHITPPSHLAFLLPQASQCHAFHAADWAQLVPEGLLDPPNQAFVVGLVHGVEVVEIQEDDLLRVLSEECINLHQSIPNLDAKEPVDEVDLLVGVPRLGRHTQVKVADASLQLLPEGQVLSYRPLLH